MEGVKENWER